MPQTSSTSLASALLCGVVVSACGTSARLENARRETARVQLHTLEMAAELAYMKKGSYPPGMEGLEVDRRDDPWGRPFVYLVSGTGAATTVKLSSLGPDGIPSADDVRLEKKTP